jgi:hypothetical protein
MLNGLFGYEWKLGTRSLLSTNAKASYGGGKRDVPMMISVTDDDPYIYDYTKAYSKRLADYFRLDVNVNLKTNYKHCSVEVFLEADNLTNHKNIWRKFYDVGRQEERYMYQYGFMPGGGCRVYF